MEKKETSKLLHFEYSFVLCWNWDAAESRSEIAEKFLNVLLEMDGKDQMDRSF